MGRVGNCRRQRIAKDGSSFFSVHPDVVGEGCGRRAAASPRRSGAVRIAQRPCPPAGRGRGCRSATTSTKNIGMRPLSLELRALNRDHFCFTSLRWLALLSGPPAVMQSNRLTIQFSPRGLWRCVLEVGLLLNSLMTASASVYYRFNVAAETPAGGLTGVGTGPSINDKGNVAFVGKFGNSPSVMMWSPTTEKVTGLI